MADPTTSPQVQGASTPAAPINLVDIKEPQLPDPFYLTPLDVVMAFFIIALLIYIVRRIYQRWQANAPRRIAIKQLNSLEKPSASDINLLLKRYIRSVASSHSALTQTGDPWQQFLAQTVQNNPHPLPDITALLYQPAIDDGALQAFQQYALYWLSHIKVGALHA
jgi:hypothetical protein